MISVDVKKKELIGNFKQEERTWQAQAVEVYDHDFPTTALGKLIPFGIYDIPHNRGYIVAGTSHDTPEFAVEAIAWWWETFGRIAYPWATELLILCDSGGSNEYRPRLWKWELQRQLVDRIGIMVTVCHFPTGTSEWNPIEHRLFSFISLNWAGKPLTSYEVALGYIRSTRTHQGLTVEVLLVIKEYPIGIKISEEQMKTIHMKRHELCPQWNYTIYPRSNQATT